MSRCPGGDVEGSRSEDLADSINGLEIAHVAEVSASHSGRKIRYID